MLVAEGGGAGGEVGSGDQLEECSRSSSREASGLSKPTGRRARARVADACGHADGDAFGALASRFGKRAGRMVGSWLRRREAVLVDAFVDVADYLHNRSHLALGVTGAAGPRLPGVPVALAGDEGAAQRPGLHEARGCRRSRRRRGVVVTHDLADDAGGLGERGGGGIRRTWRGQDTAVDG